jgi:CRISPR-associated protein Cas2
VYVILVYDVGEKRVGKVCKFLRRYLPHVQNSVFEGDITEAKLEALKAGLHRIMDEAEDAVLIWKLREARWADREIMGCEKRPVSQFL